MLVSSHCLRGLYFFFARLHSWSYQNSSTFPSILFLHLSGQWRTMTFLPENIFLFYTTCYCYFSFWFYQSCKIKQIWFVLRYLGKCLKETWNSFKNWPLNLWWISNKAIMEVGNITKAGIFKSFLHLSYQNTQLLFL